MKLNKSFLIGAMGLGLFACSDDNGLDNNIPGNEPQKGEGYAAISLDFSNMSARAVNASTDGSEHAGTSGEQAVKSLYVILASSDGSYTDADVKGGTVETLATDYSDNTYVFSTNAGVKNIYVVVNPDVIPTSATTKTIDSYFNALDEITGHSTNGFMMSSTRMVQITVLSGTTKTEAIARAAEVDVERVEAKITATYTKGQTIEFTGGTEDGTKGTIGALTYDLYCANTKGYRMSQGTTTAIAFNPAATAIGTKVKPGVQPAALTDDDNLIYCLENISVASGDDAAYPLSEVAYIDFNTTYIPSKVINANGELDDNEATTPSTFYYITSANSAEAESMIGSYMLESVYDANAETLGISGVKYEGGVCHFGSIVAGNQDEGKKGEILRNHWYNYEITSLTLPGHPEVVPPGALTYMAVKLTVLPWNFRTFEVTLN